MNEVNKEFVENYELFDDNSTKLNNRRSVIVIIVVFNSKVQS